ncbi:MAG TPA: hypothetical protein VIA80_18285, partial [Hyphomonadaceae bacterium]
VWALGQFGHVFLGPQYAAREPLVIEPEIVAANDQPAPPAATPNSAPTLQSQPAAPAAPAPAPTPVPQGAAGAAPATTDAAPPASTEVAPAETARRVNPLQAENLDGTGPSLRSIVPQDAPAQAAPPPPPPPPPPASEPTVTAQSEPVYEPAQAAPAPAALGGLESQFKSRKVTYNRPPAKLVLNKAIDVSLVVNATDDADAGKDALQGFPGEVVERDVDLSDTVSAQLTGIGFDISTQTVERQKLSGRTINRWQWRVTPTELGTRTLILEVFGYESGSLDAEPLAAYRDEIVVEVQQLDQIITWAKGVQPVFAVLAALAGAASALFAFLRFREERKRGKTS